MIEIKPPITLLPAYGLPATLQRRRPLQAGRDATGAQAVSKRKSTWKHGSP
jgi:hypothetical protein